MRFVSLIALLLFTAPAAYAADTTIAITQGTGTTLVVSPDGSGNFIPHSIVCDHNTPTQCVAIGASGQESTNLTFVNGNAALAGAGVVGTGSLRIAVGQDTTTVAGSAPGTAGTASANVVTVQGVSGMTPVQVSQATAANLNATVTGTVAATESGTWTVQPGNTANTTAWLVTGTGGTFPASQSGTWNITSILGTVSLPTGAATAVNQTSVIGTVAAGTAATNSELIGGVYNTSGPSLSNGQQAGVQLDSSGNIKVNCITGCGGGGGGGGTSQADESGFTQGTTALTPIGGFYSSSPATLTSGQAGAVQITSDRQLYVNVGKINAVTVLTGAGAVGTGAQRIAVGQDTTTIAGAAPGTAGTASSNVVTVQGVASMTPIQVSQATAANLNATVTGTVAATESGTWNITNISGTVSLPTGAATAANQTAVAGSATGGTAATSSTLQGGIYNSSAPTLTTGQQAAAQLDVNGNQKVNVAAGTVAATQSGTWNVTNISGTVSLPTGAATAANQTSIIGSVAAGTAAANSMLQGGVYNSTPPSLTNGQQAAQQFDISGNTKVNVSAGTVAVTQGTASNLLAEVGGLAASGAAVSGNPVLHGGRAENAEPTAVTNGQAVDDARDLTGKEIVMPYANKENFLSGNATITTATNTSLISAQAAGIKVYLTGFSCSNTGASTSLVTFTSGTGGTALWNSIVPAGGGTNGTISPPVATATATALFVTTATASTSIVCSVTGYAGT